MKAECKYCKKVYVADSEFHGTSNLLSRVATCAKNPYNTEVNRQKTLGFQPTKDGEEGVELVSLSFSVEAARRALAEMVVIDELSFRFVEGISFRRFCGVLQPKFKTIPSRTTITRDIVGIFNHEKHKLKKVLRGLRVCLTTDTWTSIQNLNYMCLTAHFIDDDWKLQKRIINFCQVEDHKGDTLGKKIEMCLLEWNIDSIFTITVDNASSNNNIIKFLKRKTKNWKGSVLEHEFLHMRCCAHILNLIVGDGLKELNTSIARVRDVVRYVRSSPNRFEIFKKCAEKQKIDCKGLLCLDVPTRWNSTYLMLEAACKFESAFERMEEDDTNFKYHYLDYDIGGDEMTGISGGITSTLPTKQDWDNCRVLVKFLKLFYNATKRFSGSLYVTSNYFFDDIVVIENKIQQLINRKEDLFLSSMAKKMKEKFDKYWGGVDKINLLVYIAVVLDPRKKLKYLKFCLSQFLEETIVNEMINQVNNCLIRLYEFYGSQQSVTVEVPSASETSILEVDDDCDDPHALIACQFSSYLEEEYSSVSIQVCVELKLTSTSETTVKVQKMSRLIYWLGGKLILQSIQRCPN